MNIFGMTDKGRTRKNNEDAFYVSSDKVGIFDSLMIVADGMGGHLSGEVASSTAIDEIVNTILEYSDDTPEFIMEQAVSMANLAVIKTADKTKSYGMGTTCVMAGVIGNQVCIANIGDSRLYLIDKEDGFIHQITKDHSYVEQQVELGFMERGSEAYEQQKNMITRAIGIYSEVLPDFFNLRISAGQYLLLCSDGLSNMVSNAEIMKEVLAENKSVEKKVKNLISLANKKGGRDNITVVLFAKGEMND